VDEDVKVSAYVQVGELERPSKGEDQRNVFLSKLGRDLSGTARLDMCWWPGRYTARQRRIIVDVEFEEVKERIGNHWYRTVEFYTDDALVPWPLRDR